MLFACLCSTARCLLTGLALNLCQCITAGARSHDGGSLSNGLAALMQPFKLRLRRAPEDGSLRDYSSNIVLIEPLATMAAVEEFLLPRVDIPGGDAERSAPAAPAVGGDQESREARAGHHDAHPAPDMSINDKPAPQPDTTSRPRTRAMDMRRAPSESAGAEVAPRPASAAPTAPAPVPARAWPAVPRRITRAAAALGQEEQAADAMAAASPADMAIDEAERLIMLQVSSS